MTADETSQNDASSPPVLASAISRKRLVDQREQQEEFTTTRKGGFFGNRWFGSPKPLNPVEAFLQTSVTFKRLEAAKEEISEKTPSPPISNSLRLREGINLPIVGEVRWDLLKLYAWNWLKKPQNLVLLLWLLGVVVSGGLLFMVMVGMLNSAVPNKKDRNAWFEVNNQIINALFTLMCLYVHPLRFMHLYRLYTWQPPDIIALRKVYCKDGTRKPHEWAHMMVVVLLLHLNCFSQYALCGLNWGYKRSKRPAIGVAICLSAAIGCAAAAGIYNIVSPLGKDYAEEDASETTLALDKCENGGEVSKTQRLLQRRVSFASTDGKLVENPEWRGGLFDFKDDPGSSLLSTICCFCVFGWNMDRLGFGNRYVHMVTFLLICSAPFFVLNLAAVNIDNDTVRKCLGAAGIVLSIFGLMYGGYWRIKMRETFNLPAKTWCCNEPNMTDCTQWMFCSVCSLCQEVRTAEYYQVKDEKFYLRPVPSGPSPLDREAPQNTSFSPSSIQASPTFSNYALSGSFSDSPSQKADLEESELPKQAEYRDQQHPMVAPEPVTVEMADISLRP
ncbi:hypothetical protein O6H91_16G062300 [Diphasiastrum complanatum]|uniref:Uncharacterized protein n=2 Tax=Diphasiastrum complanatum TaxID=34168 RepID=A0ACC2BCU0_DIPCM|nr:hypothetical protein O6H91_16G062300 [Diphasiastrum complanatum]